MLNRMSHRFSHFGLTQKLTDYGETSDQAEAKP